MEVRNGRIARIGRLEGSPEVPEIDADGLVLTPTGALPGSVLRFNR